MRWILVLAALALLAPGLALAQDDPNDAPLGDVAREMRRKNAASAGVIDNDNLPEVMDQAASRRPANSVVRFLLGGWKNSRPATPAVTCSLSFIANAKTLPQGQYAEMELPAGEVIKLEGPATMEGDALKVAVFNATEWHVSELAVALTIVRTDWPRNALLPGDVALGDLTASSATKVPESGGGPPLEPEARSERKPDVTVIYRMRAPAAPFATTVFTAPLNQALAPDQEWHWAIVEARGYPPESYAGDAPRSAAQTADPALMQPSSAAAMGRPQNPPAAVLSQNPR